MLLKLELYSPDELARIIRRSAGLLRVPCDEEGAAQLAACSRGTPRVANRLLKRVRDFAEVMGNGVITGETAKIALERMDIDELGLDELDRSPVAGDHRTVRRRAGRSGHTGCGARRRVGHAGGCLRALSDADGISRPYPPAAAV